MRILTTSLIVATLAVTACSSVRDSRVNPLNWFGRSQSEPIRPADAEEVNPLIPSNRDRGLFRRSRSQVEVYPGSPIDQVSELVIERVPGGAIIRASGVSDVLGIYDVQLTPQNDEELAVDGVLTYRLEGVRPTRVIRGGTQRQRTVTAARRLTDNQLARAKVIRIEGLRNAQTTTRR